MFNCISCAKMGDGGDEEEEGRGSTTPNTKDAVKSLTTQIKDMASKFSSGSNSKQGKASSSSSSNLRKEERKYPDLESYPYDMRGSTSSTPAWDFTSSSRHPSRFYGGDHRESISAQSCDVVVEDEDEPKEWMAQVEPGVHITFVLLPSGGNDLKRIRFSRDVFDKWQAQRWWGENYDRIVELYNVERFNRQALQTPGRSEDQSIRDSSYTRIESARESRDWTPRNNFRPPPMELPRTTTDEPPSLSNASEMQPEWVEEDEPGVYITIRQLPDGTRELRRVRFSRERFGEVHAKTWWEQNRDRIQTQYL